MLLAALDQSWTIKAAY